MKIDDLKDKIETFDEDIRNFEELAEALETSYQQLQAISEQLENTEKHYELLIENMSDIVWMTDIDANIIYINDTVNDILGYDKSEMIGKKLYEFMCPLHEYKVGSCKACVFSMNDLEFFREEMWMLHKDGKTRKVLEVNTSHVYHNGSIVEIQGIGRDITKRIQIERKINQKNKYMKFIHEISSSINQKITLNNLDELLDATCKNIVMTMNVDLCSIRLLEDDGLILKGAYGRYKDVVCQPIMSLDEPMVSRALQTRLPFILKKDDVKESSDEIRNAFQHPQIKEMLVIPLNTNNATIGVLIIATENKYEDEHISLYASLANNIAFASEKSNLYKGLKTFYLDIIMTLVAAMEAKDPYTQGHSLRVSEFSMKIAKKMNMSKEDIDDIEIAGILHDIGKIGIRNSILTKPGKLTREEFEEIKLHPTIGMKIMERIDLSKNISDGILYHHLRMDLHGYPQGSGLKELPKFAKIIGAADALDAMTSDRLYKKSMDIEYVKQEFIRFSGSQFCPIVVDVIIELLNSKEIIPLNCK